MFIELVDLLRCTRPHAESWLVAAADRMNGRHVVEGRLGCPVCRAEYAIREGVAYFDTARDADFDARDRSALLPAEIERVTRVAALLGLTEPGGVVALGGRSVAVATALVELTDVHVLAVNPPAGWLPDDSHSSGVSVIRIGSALPLAEAAIRGAVLDESTSTEALLAGFARAVRAGGRVVAPSGIGVPPALVELARDAREWVAEKGATPSAPVALRRRPGSAYGEG